MQPIRQLEEQISDLQTENEELSQTLAELRVAKSSLHKAQEDAELVLQEARHKAVNNASQIDVTVSNIQQNERDIGSLKRKLEQTKRDEAIHALYEKQPAFWTALAERINFHRSELNAEFEGISETKDAVQVCEAMESFIERPTFSSQAATIRQAQTVYEQTLKNVCALAVDKKPIALEHKQARTNVLDRFLHHREIVGLWS